MRKEIAVPAFGDRNVRSGYGAILPGPRIKCVEESVVGLGNVLISKSWQPSEESYGAEAFCGQTGTGTFDGEGTGRCSPHLLRGEGLLRPAKFQYLSYGFSCPAGPYQEENTTRAEFNALNKGKFDEKKRRSSIHGFVLQRVTLD
jgi:hypothetical protein